MLPRRCARDPASSRLWGVGHQSTPAQPLAMGGLASAKECEGDMQRQRAATGLSRACVAPAAANPHDHVQWAPHPPGAPGPRAPSCIILRGQTRSDLPPPRLATVSLAPSAASLPPRHPQPALGLRRTGGCAVAVTWSPKTRGSASTRLSAACWAGRCLEASLVDIVSNGRCCFAARLGLGMAGTTEPSP